jgi:glucose-1-phosphate thymidylyltransferase
MGSTSCCGARVFAYRVEGPERYGVVTLDPDGRPVSLEEKPREPKSNWAVIGLYFYDETAVERVEQVKPSARGEYEITDLSRLYLYDESLHVALLGRGFAWFDAGTHSSLLEAAEFVRVMQKRQGQLISSPDEVAFVNGWIAPEQLLAEGRQLKNDYGRALAKLIGPAARNWPSEAVG